MKFSKLTTLILGLLILGCNQADTKTTSVKMEEASASTDDKEQIQNLIRQVLTWADSNNSIDLLPTITDSKDNIYIGFNLDKHNQNLEKLRQTNFFATEFIENYNQIILAIDKGLRNGKYEHWLVGELPTFSFANDWSPWCCCQGDNLEESFELEVIEMSTVAGELKYKRDKDSSWMDFVIRVEKENGIWKIAYLQGFDFKAGTKADGQL